MDEDSKQALIEEEKAAYDVPLDSAIHKADVPHETPAELDMEAKTWYSTYMHVFPNFEEAEYFAMLPLSKKDKMGILKRALHFSEEARKLKNKWVAPVSSR